MRTAGRGPSRDLPRTDSRLDSRRDEAGRGGEAQVERRVREARGGCQSGRDETWRRITSDNDGNAKMQCTSSSTAALGRDGGRRQIMRCYRARASAVRRSGGAKDGVVARLVFRTLSSVPDSQFVVSVVVGLEVAGWCHARRGKKKRGDPSNSIPGVEGAPRPPHRLFLAPPPPSPGTLSLSTTTGFKTPALSLAGSQRMATPESRPSGPLPRRARVRKSGDTGTIRRRCAFLC